MAKTTKKNIKNKSGLMRRFDLSNKRVRFISVIVIIAVIGGGWLTLRSFAASQRVGTWYGNESYIEKGNRALFINEPRKNNQRVLVLPKTNGNGYVSATTKSRVFLSFNKQYSICVRGRGAGDLEFFYDNHAAMDKGSFKFSDTEYQLKCNEIINHNSATAGAFITLQNQSKHSNIYISEFYVAFGTPSEAK